MVSLCDVGQIATGEAGRCMAGDELMSCRFSCCRKSERCHDYNRHTIGQTGKSKRLKESGSSTTGVKTLTSYVKVDLHHFLPFLPLTFTFSLDYKCLVPNKAPCEAIGPQSNKTLVSLFLFTWCTKASTATADCEFDPEVVSLVIYTYLYLGQRCIVCRVHVPYCKTHVYILWWCRKNTNN